MWVVYSLEQPLTAEQQLLHLLISEARTQKWELAQLVEKRLKSGTKVHRSREPGSICWWRQWGLWKQGTLWWESAWPSSWEPLFYWWENLFDFNYARILVGFWTLQIKAMTGCVFTTFITIQLFHKPFHLLPQTYFIFHCYKREHTNELMLDIFIYPVNRCARCGSHYVTGTISNLWPNWDKRLLLWSFRLKNKKGGKRTLFLMLGLQI